MIERLAWDSLENEAFTFSFLDKAAAEFLLAPFPNACLSQAVFLAYLFAASRNGFSSIQIKPVILPDIHELWKEDEALRLHIREGEKKISLILKDLPIIEARGKYYLQRNFALQKKCFAEWQRLNSGGANPLFKCSSLEELKKNSLTEEQLAAIELGVSSQVFILTGGPGTGKTYTAARLLDTLLKSCDGNSCEIALAAPTGKAALTLETALRKYFGEPFSLKAKTIHSLLGIKADGVPSQSVALPYDVVLVDEASMIDLELMVLLLSSIKTGARLILMGDPYQLPPVEGSPIFPDLVNSHSAVGKLNKCLRVESEELIEFAGSIYSKNPFTPQRAVTFLSEEALLEEILESYFSRYQIAADLPTEDLIAAFQKFRILTPLKIGPCGSNEINQWMMKRLHHDGLKAIPLMITSNDYRLGLFNGEIGVLVTDKPYRPGVFSLEDYVYFANGKKIPALLLPSHELAYAMTVHKSQGSEFDEVLFLVPETKNAVSLALIYTAATRARKKIALWGKGYGSPTIHQVSLK